MNGVLGVKLGMAQHFADDGKVVPVTMIRVGPCIVVQKKTVAADGYAAVQLGLEAPGRKVRNRPAAARLRAAGADGSTSVLREFRADRNEAVEVGARFGAEVFSTRDRVRVTGISKGKGFAGVMKRHGFGGGPKSHGSKFHRAPGAIGMCATPSRVLPGTRLPGHLGFRRVTVRNLRVVEVDPDRNLLSVRGAVPGPRGGTLEIRRERTRA